MLGGWLTVMLLAFGFLFAGGCEKPVAVVNKKKIDRKTLDQRLKEQAYELNRQRVAFSEAELRQRVLKDLIDEALILEEAKKRGLGVTDEELAAEITAVRKLLGDREYRKMLEELAVSEDAFRQRTRDKILVLKFMNSMVAPASVTDEELRMQYQSSQTPFFKSAKVLMKLIEVQSEEKAQEIAAEIRKNKSDFDAIADRYSRSDTSIMHTSGWTNPDYFRPPISDAMKELKVGQFGGPYRGKNGFFLIRIEDRKKEEIATFDEVKETIRNSLLEQKRQTAVAQWVAEARKGATLQENVKGKGQ